MPVLVLNTGMDANMQLTINSFLATFPWQDFFSNISLIFSKIPDISLTAVKFPDISRFSRQVVTVYVYTRVTIKTNLNNTVKKDTQQATDNQLSKTSRSWRQKQEDRTATQASTDPFQ